MEIKQLLTDNDAVSPVIGVILMVAITVILAAVIGTFVLGLGDQVQDNAPQASFTFDLDESGEDATTGNHLTNDGDDTNDALLTVTHDGGDKIPAARLETTDGTDTLSGGTAPFFGSTTDVSAGNQASFDVDTTDTVRIIWTAEGGGNSATLGKFSGPDA